VWGKLFDTLGGVKKKFRKSRKHILKANAKLHNPAQYARWTGMKKDAKKMRKEGVKGKDILQALGAKYNTKKKKSGLLTPSGGFRSHSGNMERRNGKEADRKETAERKKEFVRKGANIKANKKPKGTYNKYLGLKPGAYIEQNRQKRDTTTEYYRYDSDDENCHNYM